MELFVDQRKRLDDRSRRGDYDPEVIKLLFDRPPRALGAVR